MKAGYEAQLKSIVLLKNKSNVLPIKAKKKVYVPKRFYKGMADWFGHTTPDRWDYPVKLSTISKYYTVVDAPDKADFAIVFIESPNSGTGYSKEDRTNGGNGYVPISLQYNDYQATTAREVSIAGGDPFEKSANRSYKNKSVVTANKSDMQLVQDTKNAMSENI